MILIGQYDSPFVRRVGIALRLYGMPFEHRPWSTFGDADWIAPINPLRRVPTLVLWGWRGPGDGGWRSSSEATARALDRCPSAESVQARKSLITLEILPDGL